MTIENPYPTDVFIEPTKEEWTKFHRVLKENGLTGDAFCGSCSRLGWNNCVEDLRARTEKRIKELEKEESKQTNQTLKLKVGGAIREDEMLLASLQPFLPDKPAKEGPGGKKKKKEHRAFEYVMGFAKKSGSEGK